MSTEILGATEILDNLYCKQLDKHSIFSLTLKMPITTAADDKFCDIFPSFRQK